jgi:hypothetical protein
MLLTGTCFFLFIDVRFGLLGFTKIVLLEMASWFQLFTDHRLVSQNLVELFTRSSYLVKVDFKFISFVRGPNKLNCKIRHKN